MSGRIFTRGCSFSLNRKRPASSPGKCQFFVTRDTDRKHQGGKVSVAIGVLNQSSWKFCVELYSGFVELLPEHDLLHAVVLQTTSKQEELYEVRNVTAHTQKTDFVFRRNGRVHLNRRGLQFSRLLAAEVCASAVVMKDTPCSEVVWRVLATHSIRQFPLHFPSRALPCSITFQLESTAAVLARSLH